MAHFSIKKLWAAAIMIAAALFTVSCEGTIAPKEDPSLNSAYESNMKSKTISENDVIVEYEGDNKQMWFEGGDVEYSFSHNALYRDAGKNFIETISTKRAFDAIGTEAQIFDGLKTFDYTTTGGNSSKSTNELPKNNGWFETVSKLVQPWNAKNNAENHNFDHQAEGWGSAMVYEFYDEALKRGYTVDFPAPEITISGKQLGNETVTGVVYNGKTYEAVKYTYAWVVTATIPEAYRVAGKKYTDTREGVNVAYFLLHEVKSNVEDQTYKVNILDGAKIYKEYQTVKFNIVTRDNGEVVTSDPYTLEEAFNITPTQVEDVEVFSEDALKDTKVTFTAGKINASAETENIFTKTSYNAEDKASMADGRSVNVAVAYEGYAWGSTKFPYASVVSRKADLKSVKNTAESTAARIVYDVTLTLTYTIAYNNSDKKDETKVIVINYKRFMKVDNFETRIENQKYTFRGQVNQAKNQFVATTNENSWEENTYKNGTVTSTLKHAIDMPHSVVFEGGDVVAINQNLEGKTVTVKSTNPGVATSVDTPVEGEDGYVIRTFTQTMTATLSDNAKVRMTYKWSQLRKDGQVVMGYTDAKNPRISTIEIPVKDNALSSGENRVYGVKVHALIDMEEHAGVQTRAAGDTRTEELVADYQQTLGDEYDPSKDRVVWTVTPTGNGYDIKGQKFETTTLNGEAEVSQVSGSVKFSVVGKNGSLKTVQNVNYQTNGNGWSGTGTTTYRDNASNGVSSDGFQNEYDVTADGKLTLTLKGKNGQDVSKTFNPMLTLTEGGQNITTTGSTSTYTSYNYTNKVNAVYALEGKEVSASATASRELRVAKPSNIPDLIPGKIKGASITCVPANGDNASNYADGNGTRNAIKCLTIVSDQGAEPVPFAPWNSDVVVPTANEIQSGNFVNGSYTTDYNSGYDPKQNGVWVPAVAKDTSKGVGYYVNGDCVRSIRNETLKQWGWRGGNYSVFVTGYTFNVDNDGVLTIRYNGEVVLQCK